MLKWKEKKSPESIVCGYGFYSTWEIEWLLPSEVHDGFVIQKIESKFDVRDCSGIIIEEQEIWSRLGLPGHARFKFYEAWPVKDRHWPFGAVDIWKNEPGQKSKNIKTFGTCVVEAWADFYKGTDLMAFGGGWGSNGQNFGSPASQKMMSTIEHLSLTPKPAVYRKLEISWNDCGELCPDKLKFDYDA